MERTRRPIRYFLFPLEIALRANLNNKHIFWLKSKNCQLNNYLTTKLVELGQLRLIFTLTVAPLSSLYFYLYSLRTSVRHYTLYSDSE